MDWVKLSTNFYLDPAIMRAGEPAEVLFTRGLAYAGDHETEGLIPREVLSRLAPTRSTARASALVREGLWEVVPGGWRITRWDEWQASSEQLAASRKGNRVRQARFRAARNGVRNAVTNGDVTATEAEAELEDAAAAASLPPQPVDNDLPGDLQILRSKLNVRKLVVRWDKLTAEQRAEISNLIKTHGDAQLVKTALNAFQPNNPPVYAQAWLNDWRAIPEPGHLRIVDAPPCPEPGHQGTTQRCGDCIIAAKIGDQQ